MTENEKTQRQIGCLEHAIAAVKRNAAEDQRVTHAKHMDNHYATALDCLELKLTGLRAYALRVETIGR
jgi:hypothetical protein